MPFPGVRVVGNANSANYTSIYDFGLNICMKTLREMINLIESVDQQRKIFKKNGQPVGEVGIDRESSPGVGQWYMKCYAYNIDNSGYDSYEEAVEELKHCLKQGVAEEQVEESTPDALAKIDNLFRK